MEQKSLLIIKTVLVGVASMVPTFIYFCLLSDKDEAYVSILLLPFYFLFIFFILGLVYNDRKQDIKFILVYAASIYAACIVNFLLLSFFGLDPGRFIFLFILTSPGTLLLSSTGYLLGVFVRFVSKKLHWIFSIILISLISFGLLELLLNI